ncbi:MAG: sigma-54-dependent Fis family transcriptional regulator, partial [Planctomycetes bacterium]|nr:sigma-54-dependent Fis family transcriptional regulator [Planctomycetota bacterium]
VLGVSKRRLPELLTSEGRKWKRVHLIGLSLGGDEARLAAALKALKGKTRVSWISALPMSEAQRAALAPLLEVHEFDGGPFNGSLLKAVGATFGRDVKEFLPFVNEGARAPKLARAYHELFDAAMHAYRSYRDQGSYAAAIRQLSALAAEDEWSPELRRLVVQYRLYGHRELAGKGPKMEELRQDIAKVAAHPEARVLIIGESGTGKETVALQIHALSPRRNEPFYAFNCASVTPNLLESRFFGHEKGAFTGADRQEPGLFELADGGTLFLDEIGELPLEAQGVLLRVLEGGRFLRVGGREEIKTDVRLVTATNRDLPRMVRAGKFREDLFMRLNVVQMRVPPLREHKEDIRDIADNWWFGRFKKHLSPAQVAALNDYDYPGNVRELLNLLERAAVLGEADFARLVTRHRQMNAGLFPAPGDSAQTAGGAAAPLAVCAPAASATEELDAVLRRHVREVLRKYAQNVTRAASALNISRNTLKRYLKKKDRPPVKK